MVSASGDMAWDYGTATVTTPDGVTTPMQYLVVWVDDRKSATPSFDIYGQRVSASGSRLGPDFRVSGRNATSDERDPAVAYNPDAGEYLVVWGDGRNGTQDIYFNYSMDLGNGSPYGQGEVCE